MVLSTRPLIDICPVQPAAMEGRQVVQWDKDSCADAGFLKIDLLGLGMLSAVERCVEQIAEARNERIDLSRIPLDDPQTFEAIRAAETTGVFQIESRAQMQMLPRSRPETIDDVIVQVALVRPGPIQGGAVHPYLERRKRLREDPSFEIPYEHPDMEPILADTLGAIVFQDQVIQVAMTLAGFAAGEAEGLRRAMSRKRSEEALNAYGERFVAGAVGRGVDRELAERVFEQVRGFSGFGFPKSHAAAFGLLAYQSTWLRVHYGPELLCALFNEQPMGFYPPDTLTHEAQRRGIEIRPVDVNRSDVECTVEPTLDFRLDAERRAGGSARPRLRQGRRGGGGAGAGERARRARPLPRPGRPRLAFRGQRRRARAARLGRRLRAARPRRAAGRRAATSSGGLGVARGGERMRGRPHAQLALPLPLPAPPELRPLDSWERIVADYSATGISLGEHPVEVLRPQLDRRLTLHRRACSDARRGDDRRRRAWSSPASARRPPRASCSCCSRTRAGSST